MTVTTDLSSRRILLVGGTSGITLEIARPANGPSDGLDPGAIHAALDAKVVGSRSDA